MRYVLLVPSVMSAILTRLAVKTIPVATAATPAISVRALLVIRPGGFSTSVVLGGPLG